jgi:Binding-prot-dependent transport system membrane comp, N-term
MRRYLAHRLVAALGVSFVVFLALHLAPGDPAQILLGPMATPTELTALRGQLGLDQPVLVQYGRWVSRAAHGDLGRSIMLRRALRARRFGGGTLGEIEIHAVPHRVRGRPRTEDRRELARILNRPVLSAKRQNCPNLVGTDARELEELGRIREIDPDRMRHGRLLAEPNVLSSERRNLRPRIRAKGCRVKSPPTAAAP